MKKIHKRLLIVLTSLVVVVCGAFGILYMNGFSGMQPISEPKEGQIRVACVGDSITYGHGIINWAKDNYPSVLQDLLGDDYCVNNYGVSGYCVDIDDTEAMRSKISLLLRDETLANQIGIAAKHKAEKYATQSVIKELEQIYL